MSTVCKGYFLLLNFLFFFSTGSAQENPAVQKTKILEAKGVVIQLDERKAPQKILLSDMPKPVAFEVPTEGSSSVTTQENGKEKKLELLPPLVRPAGFFFVMPNITNSMGLPLDAVYQSQIDRDGNLWIATWGGVSRYDGDGFTNYLFKELLTGRAILQDKEGNQWFGTEDAVGKYDGVSFKIFTKDDGLAANYVRCIFQDKQGNLWFGTIEGASRYDGKSFTNFNVTHGLISNQVWSVLEDKTGHFWFGTEGGVSKYDGKSFVNYTVDNGLVSNSVHYIIEDKKGNLWFGTEGGVSKYDGESFSNITSAKGLVNDIVWTIYEDTNGDLWFGTQQGMTRYDGQSMMNFTKSEGLPNNIIKSFAENIKAKNLWISTYGGGVCRYDGDVFTNFKEAQGLPNPGGIRCIVQDQKGIFWLAGEAGMDRYDGKTFTNYSANQGIPGLEIRGLFIDSDGTLWLGTVGGGLVLFHDQSVTIYTKAQGLAHDDVRYILKDRTGKFWLGTYGGGVSLFDGTSFTNYTEAEGLVDNYVQGVLEDRSGNLWFNTDNGISKYDGKTFTNYTKAQGLSSNYITSSFEDEVGNIWFSSYGGGLIRYDGTSFINYTMEDGMPNNDVYRTISMKEKYLFIGTNKGFAILTGFKAKSSTSTNRAELLPPQNTMSNQELKENYQPVFEVYNAGNGYPVRDLNSGQSSIYRDKEGIIWFGTGSDSTGFVRFNYNALYHNTHPPKIVIKGLTVNNTKICWYNLKDAKASHADYTIPPNVAEEVIVLGRELKEDERKAMRHQFGDIKFTGISKFYYIPENLKLPHSHNQISFNFAAIELDNPQNVLYQYKLEGYEDEWSPPSHENKAHYGNLFEGNYTLKIKAKSTFGTWSEPISYSFSILPPLYRTWWAYLLYAVTSISAIYLIVRWRLENLKRKYEITQNLYIAAERFVPRRFLELLQRERFEEVTLGDRVKKNITVLFNDIRSFTTLVEKRDPESAFDFVNRYWKFIAPIIRKHNGYIDQFQGDALLAIFPDKPEDAVRTSIAMMEALEEFNATQQKLKDVSVRMGIGISTGPAVLGIIGEPGRHVAGIISDVANTAARVEGLNRLYGSLVLLTGATIQAGSWEHLILRKLDFVLLKGKTKPTEVYEVVFWKKQLKGITFDDYIALFQGAFDKYAAGDFESALAGFNKCLVHYPKDMAVATFIGRCNLFLAEGTPEGWNGTFIMKTK